MYYTAVRDHVYGAYLVTLDPFTRRTSRDAEQYGLTAGSFWALLCSMLQITAMQGLCLYCAFCGKTERVKSEEQAQVIKVSRSHCFARRVGAVLPTRVLQVENELKLHSWSANQFRAVFSIEIGRLKNACFQEPAGNICGGVCRGVKHHSMICA